MTSEKWWRLSEVYYKEGWLFFVPYLCVYLVAWVFGIPQNATLRLFWLLHLTNLGLLAFYLTRFPYRRWKLEWWFWGTLFIVLLLPGASLEFPGEPWEAFRRLIAWESTRSIAQNESSRQFPYFWGWTCLSPFSIAWRRLGLAFYSAFWQWLFAYQFSRFVARLGFTRNWVWIQTIAVLILFGTNVFSLRYEALSPTMLAYLCYLQAMSVLMDHLQRGPRRAWMLIPLAALIGFSQAEGLGLLAIGSAALTCDHLYGRLGTERKRWFRWTLAAVLVVPTVVSLGMGMGTENWVGFFLGRSPIAEVLGMSGIVALFLSVLYFWRRRQIACLTMVPFITLMYPPTAVLVGLLMKTSHEAHRLLYLMPTSVMFVTGVWEFVRDRSFSRPWLRRDVYQQAVVLAVVLLFALPVSFPFRGRLPFQVYVAAPERTLLALDETAEWFQSNRRYSPDCQLISDGGTGFVLSTHLARPVEGSREQLELFGRYLNSPSVLKTFLQSHKVCGVLVGIRRDIPRAPYSWVAVNSSYWRPEFGDLLWLDSAEFERSTVTLVGLGWKQTWVPPYYTLYEPPKE